MHLCQFISASRVAGRWLALLVILSLVAPAGACAQAAGTGVRVQSPPAPIPDSTHLFLDKSLQAGRFPVFYVDGQQLDSAAVVKLTAGDVERISVLKDFDARLLGPIANGRGIVIVVTKAGQHTRAVRAFNRRLVRLGHRQP